MTEIKEKTEYREDVLQYAVEHNMINLADVQEKIRMEKREEILRKHRWAISLGSDGRWMTYLPDPEHGRKMVKKATRKQVEDIVITYWRSELENPTLEEVFREWNDRRLELNKIAKATYTRNCEIFERFFGKEWKYKRIRSITPDEMADFLEEQIPKYQLSAKSFSNLKSLVRGFLKRAGRRKLINWSVERMFEEIDVSECDFKRTKKQDQIEVFTEEELPVILDYLVNHLDSLNIGILLMFLTGIRVGELVALKHSDFDGNTFQVQRTETRYSLEKGKCVYEVSDFPKTEAGIRTLVIPKDYSWITEKIRRMNPFGEYIFVTRNQKRVLAATVRKRLYRICDKLGLKRKSPHKIRKTYGSILLDHSIDQKLVTQLMGHTNIACTENFYHKDRKSTEQKFNIISGIPEFMAK